MDTFSANSLKALLESKEEFIRKYENNLEFLNKNEELIEGNKFHALICYMLKGFNIEKLEDSLSVNEKTLFKRVKNSEIMDFIKNSDEKFIEQPFFIKESLNNKPFYLTGRFDLVIKNKNNFTIIDWKTKNLPKEPESDVQTIVYLHCASKLFKSKNIEMKYYSILKETEETIYYKETFLDKIKEIVSKIY